MTYTTAQMLKAIADAAGTEEFMVEDLHGEKPVIKMNDGSKPPSAKAWKAALTRDGGS